MDEFLIFVFDYPIDSLNKEAEKILISHYGHFGLIFHDYFFDNLAHAVEKFTLFLHILFFQKKRLDDSEMDD